MVSLIYEDGCDPGSIYTQGGWLCRSYDSLCNLSQSGGITHSNVHSRSDAKVKVFFPSQNLKVKNLKVCPTIRYGFAQSRSLRTYWCMDMPLYMELYGVVLVSFMAYPVFI